MQHLTRQGHNHSETFFSFFTPQCDQREIVCVCVFMSVLSLKPIVCVSQGVFLSVLMCILTWALCVCVCGHIYLFVLMVCFSTVFVCFCSCMSVCTYVCAPWKISLSCKLLTRSAPNNNKAGITNKLSFYPLIWAVNLEFLKEAHMGMADVSVSPITSTLSERNKRERDEVKEKERENLLGDMQSMSETKHYCA